MSLGALFEDDCTGAAIIDRQRLRQKIIEIGYGRLFVLANASGSLMQTTMCLSAHSSLIFYIYYSILFRKSQITFSLFLATRIDREFFTHLKCHAADAKPAPSIVREVCAFSRLVIYRFDQRINGFYFANGVLCFSTILGASFGGCLLFLAGTIAPAFCANEFGFICCLIFYIYYSRFFLKSQTFFAISVGWTRRAVVFYSDRV